MSSRDSIWKNYNSNKSTFSFPINIQLFSSLSLKHRTFLFLSDRQRYYALRNAEMLTVRHTGMFIGLFEDFSFFLLTCDCSSHKLLFLLCSSYAILAHGLISFLLIFSGSHTENVTYRVSNRVSNRVYPIHPNF